ncbi:hypothetical protein [Aerococcus mictus]|uniref:hypothetical protein n=1 Tax=Aerococcus mictus TaxID=2976810 RepID=UPI000DCEBC03|nr:hypothetical protein [Aerococcus mictus]RAV84542.1 hypothetical protein DBT52_00735 [Aerococcus mictus]
MSEKVKVPQIVAEYLEMQEKVNHWVDQSDYNDRAKLLHEAQKNGYEIETAEDVMKELEDLTINKDSTLYKLDFYSIIAFDYQREELFVDTVPYAAANTPLFLTETEALDAIDRVGRDRIKRHLFRGIHDEIED